VSKPKRLGLYADVQEILDAALASGGGEFTLESYGKAVHWRQRAYQFRKLFAQTLASKSKYDTLTLPRIPDGSCTVVINIVKQPGVFKPNTPGIDEDALEAAKQLLEGGPL